MIYTPFFVTSRAIHRWLSPIPSDEGPDVGPLEPQFFSMKLMNKVDFNLGRIQAVVFAGKLRSRLTPILFNTIF